MCSQVTLQVEICIEHPGAVRTFESLDSSMNLNVLVQVGFLSKAEFATWIVALVGSLIGVNPQVVEEVVPLSEVLSAVVVIALENLDKSLRLRILECVNFELFCVRNMLLDLD